jgi:hypothetical protein
MCERGIPNGKAWESVEAKVIGRERFGRGVGVGGKKQGDCELILSQPFGHQM